MSNRVIVIGAGLGGMSAAISLAAEGFQVSIYEKNDRIGGKLNVLNDQGFSFDLGPSIFTLPQYFRSLFARCDRNFDDYVKIVPVTPHWRNFFTDGLVFDLYKDQVQMKNEFSKLTGDTDAHWQSFVQFLEYSKKQYKIIENGYFSKGLDDLKDFLKFYGVFKLFFKIDHRRRMAQTIDKYFSEPHLKAIFEYFIKYVGSSAYQAPGFMNLMPSIQFEYDLWYVDGGLYRLAEGFGRLMDEMGVDVHLSSQVKHILKEGDRVCGLELEGGQKIEADYVVSNMEVVPTYKHLLAESDDFLHKLEKFEPTCSGLVLHLGLKKHYSQLAHHNFFYSANQKTYFKQVFEEKRLPDDPTIYLVAPTRTDPTQAPAGCDNLKILPHIPHLTEENLYSQEDYVAFKERIVDKLESMGLVGLRENVIYEDMWTPMDIEQRYRSNKGSIYGVVSDWQKNFGFKAPKRSRKYQNLYFVGGSVNPGGGMPMVTLCGQNVSSDLVRQHRSMTA